MRDLSTQIPGALSIFVSRDWTASKLEQNLSPKLTMMTSEITEADEQLCLTVWTENKNEEQSRQMELTE